MDNSKLTFPAKVTFSAKKAIPKATVCFEVQGYTMVHSAFGYGNETVLCNDPHALPYTSLDDTEAVEVAVKKSNISVKICRIGPWVFPVEVTTCFLPKGVDLPH